MCNLLHNLQLVEGGQSLVEEEEECADGQTRLLNIVYTLSRYQGYTIKKRKFKQWWSTIPPISTKRTNYFSPQVMEHKIYHFI